MRIGIVGSGISGLTAAAVFKEDGHEVVVFERGARVGGVWASTYPEVRLQNIAGQYELSQVPWTTPSDLNPTGDQMRAYLDTVVQRTQPDLRLEHTVERMEEQPNGWLVQGRSPKGEFSERFDHVVLAVGQFTQPKNPQLWPGQEQFTGQLLTEHQVRDLSALSGKRVVVVGYGKTALDLCALAANGGAAVTQVFRTARWLIPHYFFGLIHFTRILFSRFGSVMVPSWAQPNGVERAMHSATPVISGFWWAIASVLWLQMLWSTLGKGAEARARIGALKPPQSLPTDMRSATAMAPHDYFDHVAAGRITPRQGEVERFTATGLRLKDGGEVQADTVILALGSAPPVFPYLPQRYRDLLEGQPDGVQLYRHVVHPRIPNMSFAGYNHSFSHVPCVEMASWWTAAMLHGDLQLPPAEEQERVMAYVQSWKRTHSTSEPALLFGVNTRYQQYLDILLQDMGLSPYRKLPNVVAEVFGRYWPSDYAGVGAELRAARARGVYPKKVQDLPT